MKDVYVHKLTGKNAAVTPVDGLAKTPEMLANFHIVQVDLTDAEVDEIQRGHKRVTDVGDLVDVPTKDWPEKRAEAVRMAHEIHHHGLIKAYGETEAQRIVVDAFVLAKKLEAGG